MTVAEAFTLVIRTEVPGTTRSFGAVVPSAHLPERHDQGMAHRSFRDRPARHPDPLPGNCLPSLPGPGCMHQLLQRQAAGAQPAASRRAPGLQQARAIQATEEWKTRYKIRAEVEGTISQAVHACDLRRSRYHGLQKTSLQHQLTGAAINIIRINAWLTDIPRAGPAP
ncbi:transposase [Kitasatospora sp. DSM 101779]|uniref:transposase n=1 Tax=Kitasatospora sp. DSM 101779 TaxID=2853165 RepID=UPI0037EF5C6E|nr:transposase [Kitasatospora sp. DSM 101779]